MLSEQSQYPKWSHTTILWELGASNPPPSQTKSHPQMPHLTCGLSYSPGLLRAAVLGLEHSRRSSGYTCTVLRKDQGSCQDPLASSHEGCHRRSTPNALPGFLCGKVLPHYTYALPPMRSPPEPSQAFRSPKL